MLFKLFSSRDKKKIVLIFFGVLLSGLWEVVGIGSIMPFISVASNPDMIQTNVYLKWVYDYLGFGRPENFLLALGLGVVGLVILSNCSRALIEYAIQRFAAMRHHYLSLALFRQYLYRPYVSFLNLNSSDLSKNVLGEVWNLVKFVLIPGMEMLSRVVISFLIVILLIAVDPLLAVLMTAVLSSLYTLIYLLAKKKLDSLGRERLAHNGRRYKITSEAMGGIKDVKLLGKEDVFCDAFEKPSKGFSLNVALSDIIADLPKYALETVAFSSILLIILYLMYVKGNFQQIVPLVGLYAFAAYRLMPSLQLVFRGSVKIKAHVSVIELFHRHLYEEGVEIPRKHEEPEKIDFRNSLELRDIEFTYPNAGEPVLKVPALSIRCNNTIGLAGHTGCGKTTLVDIILGLLRPQRGELIVDGLLLDEKNIRGWQKNLGYVPQSIFLSDDSVANNIAFGIPQGEIDMDAVERAARTANIHDFVVREMPRGYLTEVGERGVRLSGGQRQRIGIARALYHNPSVLILDEATSALDGITENAIMDAIHNLSGKKTIIMIAHRLSTVKECDTIHLFTKGAIVDSGTYPELFERNAYFRQMANT